MPSIIASGRLVRVDGDREVQGHGIFSLSVTSPGPRQYEAPLGITLRQLIDLAGGIRRATS